MDFEIEKKLLGKLGVFEVVVFFFPLLLFNPETLSYDG